MRAASLLTAALVASACQPAWSPARARQSGLLASPGSYSFDPAPPPASQAAGGVASVGFGSRNTQTSSIALESGLLGNTGTRAFLALGQARTDLADRSGSGPRISSQGGSIGIEKQFMDGTTIAIGGGWQRDRFPYALSSRTDGVTGTP